MVEAPNAEARLRQRSPTGASMQQPASPQGRLAAPRRRPLRDLTNALPGPIAAPAIDPGTASAGLVEAAGEAGINGSFAGLTGVRGSPPPRMPRGWRNRTEADPFHAAAAPPNLATDISFGSSDDGFWGGAELEDSFEHVAPEASRGAENADMRVTRRAPPSQLLPAHSQSCAPHLKENVSPHAGTPLAARAARERPSLGSRSPSSMLAPVSPNYVTPERRPCKFGDGRPSFGSASTATSSPATISLSSLARRLREI